MLTYKDIEFFEKILNDLNEKAFFLKRYEGSNQIDLYSYAYEERIASDIHHDFLEFLNTSMFLLLKKC